MKLHEVFSYAPDVLAKKSEESYEEYADRVSPIIHKECAKWINEAGPSNFVYRGAGKWPYPVSLRDVRKDRKPKDTQLNRHAIFNQMIEEVGGTADRTNSAFVVGSPRIAREYGTVHVVFPVGDYTYTWSPRFNDWTTDFHFTEMAEFVEVTPYMIETIRDAMQDRIVSIQRELQDNPEAAFLKHYLEKYQDAIEAFPEITQASEPFFDSFKLNMLHNGDEIDFDQEELKKVIVVDRFLTEAIKKKYTEIMVNSDQVILVEAEAFDEYFKEYFL